MIDKEPMIQVGIIEGTERVHGSVSAPYTTAGGGKVSESFEVWTQRGTVFVRDHQDALVASGAVVDLVPTEGAKFTIKDVTIGINFHWERKEDQTFEGGVRFIAHPEGKVTVINRIGVEAYLGSVIASEMSATSPWELLRAHAITSRSWLVAMLERGKSGASMKVDGLQPRETADEIVRWYDREDHAHFDVCADDHCQRYQGVSKVIAPEALRAVADTRGLFLTYGDTVADARFYKACGGRTEEFQNAWEEVWIPYLTTVSDSTTEHPTAESEVYAEKWIRSSPDAFCNTTDGNILRQVLPSFDQETTDFFRWKVTYTADELSALVKSRSGMDFGAIRELIPIKRGPSGRLYALKIVGSKKTLTVGKELEIRKWLSKSHLYSSAFVVDVARASDGSAKSFTLIGAGWGHGVGLCQIGAAVMATKNYTGEEIVKHYFKGAELKKLY